jgi:hypothetical protein
MTESILERAARDPGSIQPHELAALEQAFNDNMRELVAGHVDTRLPDQRPPAPRAALDPDTLMAALRAGEADPAAGRCSPSRPARATSQRRTGRCPAGPRSARRTQPGPRPMADALTAALEVERDELAARVEELTGQLGQADADRHRALEQARRSDARLVRVQEQADALGRRLAQAEQDRADLTRRLGEAEAERDALAARVAELEAAVAEPPPEPTVTVRWLKDSTPGSCNIGGRSYVGQGPRDANPRRGQREVLGQEARLPLSAALVLYEAGYVRGASDADDQAIIDAKYPAGQRLGWGHPLDPAYDDLGRPRPRMPAGVGA